MGIQNKVFSSDGTKLKGFSSHDLIRGNAWADEFFCMGNEKGCSLLVVYMGPFCGVVHGIGKVTDQNHIFTVFGQLPHSKWPPRDTHVYMDPAEHDIFYFSGFQKIPNIDPGITNRIQFLIDN